MWSIFGPLSLANFLATYCDGQFFCRPPAFSFNLWKLFCHLYDFCTRRRRLHKKMRTMFRKLQQIRLYSKPCKPRHVCGCVYLCHLNWFCHILQCTLWFSRLYAWDYASLCQPKFLSIRIISFWGLTQYAIVSNLGLVYLQSLMLRCF